MHFPFSLSPLSPFVLFSTITRPRITFLRMTLQRRPIEDEIVEDSEPEREAARQRQDGLGGGTLNGPLSKTSNRGPSQSTVSNIIDISDDSLFESSSEINNEPSLDPKKGLAQNRDDSVIDISDSSMDLPRPPATSSNTQPSKEPAGSCFFLDLGDYDSELDNTLPELKLARFAHISAKPAPLRKPKPAPSLSVRAMSTSSGASRSIPAKKAITQSVVQRLSDRFSTDSFSRLLICVCCDLSWTTRKSVPQKLSHMKTCAKKHGIQDDTLIEMVRKGIEELPPQTESKLPESAAPKTFFDEVMNNAAPKKRHRRQEVPNTVRDIGEMRDTIMLKARTVVAQADSNIRVLREYRIGGHLSDGDSSGFLPCSTPRFGQSSLAGRAGLQARSMFHENGGSPGSTAANSPPPTPPRLLLPSIPISSHGTDKEASQMVIDTTSTDLVTPSTPAKNKHSPVRAPFTPPPPHLVYLSSSSNQTTPNISNTTRIPISPPLTPSPQKSVSSTFSPDSPEERFYPSDDEARQYMDDAYLHYEPKHNLPSTPYSKQSPIATPSPIRPSKKSKTPCHSPTTRRRERTNARERDVDETWIEDLKTKILEDEALHLRILRLEPIHFDVFLLKVGSTYQQSSGKLRSHLREFLDKQGINFYGAESMGRQRR
ncbi:hypothetical protein F5880DRAFT_1580271 [Lentinula raphanica]|nr:hypothetical protein F5880DRAFT_1580271 [Lentinula raphanica]